MNDVNTSTVDAVEVDESVELTAATPMPVKARTLTNGEWLPVLAALRNSYRPEWNFEVERANGQFNEDTQEINVLIAMKLQTVVGWPARMFLDMTSKEIADFESEFNLKYEDEQKEGALPNVKLGFTFVDNQKVITTTVTGTSRKKAFTSAERKKLASLADASERRAKRKAKKAVEAA